MNLAGHTMYILSTAISARRVSQSSAHDGESFRKPINSSDEASASKAKRASRHPRLCRHLRKTSALRHPPRAILPAPSPSRRKARLTIRGGGFALPSHDPPRAPAKRASNAQEEASPLDVLRSDRFPPRWDSCRFRRNARSPHPEKSVPPQNPTYRTPKGPFRHAPSTSPGQPDARTRPNWRRAHLMHRFRTDGRPAGSTGRRLVCISPHREPSPADKQFKPLPNPCARRDSCQFERILVSKRSGHPRPPNLVRITMREISPKMATKPRSGTGCVLPRIGLRAVEDKSPRSPLPVDCIRFASAPSSAPTRTRTRFRGHFRTILPHDLIGPAADSPKVETKERARTNNERGQGDQARPTQTQKDCNTPSRSAAAWGDQAPSHSNTEGPEATASRP